MVSVMMDFYRYREEVKRALLRRSVELEGKWDPFKASWLTYALSLEGFGSNPYLTKLIKQLERWAKDDNTWTARRNLGPLCFLGYFLKQVGSVDENLTNRIVEQIVQLQQQEDNKFSPLSDPEQVFAMALLVHSMDDSSNPAELLKRIIQRRMQGPPKRRILYGASLKELDETFPLTITTDDLHDPGDIIAYLWYCERYGDPGERAQGWEPFIRIKESLCFDQDESCEASYLCSSSDLALLYEALMHETSSPDPVLLFNYYPLHPRVKEISASLFKIGEYSNSVEEAAKALNAFIQEKTGCVTKEEAELVQSIMNPSNPKLILASKLNTESGKNEQAGLFRIAEGIFKAFRNPKAHTPKDAPQMQIDALEALDQLVIISYIFKRVERGQIK